MENNNVGNTINNAPFGNKKNVSMIIIIVIIIIAIITIVILKSGNMKPQVEVPDQTTAELNNALNTDSTSEINANLDKINLEDTSSSDLKDVDSELEKL